MENLNLKLRTRVLQYALTMEQAISTLLQSHLLIVDKETSRNFGNKAGISFKSKVDLLYDIGVINKDEAAQIDLIMNFRNKFLHDIESNSFESILSKIDPGIKNRFLRFLDKNTAKKGEEEYEKAFDNLYYQNLTMLQLKYQERRVLITNQAKCAVEAYDLINDLFNLSIAFSDEIIQTVERTDIKNIELPLFMLKCTMFYESLIAMQERFSENIKLRESLTTKGQL